MQTKNLFYKTMYLILHNLITSYKFFQNVTMYIKNYYDFCFLQTEMYILKNVTNIRKLPAHLTVLLGEDQPSLKDLANIIYWSMLSGISYISFYDIKGVTKRCQGKLKQFVEKIRLLDDRVTWHDFEDASNSNGFNNGRKITVRALSLSNGRQAIVDCAKELAVNKIGNECEDNAEDYFRKQYVFPDPDLALYCGMTLRLFGYPPWQIRLTHFLSIHTFRGFSPRTFVRLLITFSKTEQRMGK